ncbi:MAG: hypothetical protein U9O64_07565 [Campylobacterota bacterium]|nr:hypothetical protein [Campylobacterota bacterium]
MKTIVKISIITLMSSSLLFAGADKMKLYDVKSGKIEYAIQGSGEIMGSKMKTVGKKRVIFDAYGTHNLTEENKEEQQTIMGQKKTNKSHTMTYMKNGMVYTADFKQRRIMRMENMGMAMAGLMGGGQNMKQTGESMMKQMGGKKTGTDKVLGYSCDVWELMGTKQCIYKGIPLKVESNVMGLKSTEIATKAAFDISLSKDDFKLPDFPIYDMQGNKLDRRTLDAMDEKQGVQMSQEMDEMALKRVAYEKAMREAGVKPGQAPTKTQQEAMMKAMMGGNDGMLKQMKQEILSDEEMMRFGYKCLSQADTLKEANICNDKANAMGGEPEEPFDKWNPEMKKEILGFLDQYLNVMVPCVKKAQTMQAARQCMPME